jgi:UDP-glucose 4-epimerase
MENNVNNLIFSSTAAVYGDVGKAPIEEDFELKPTNPYGMSKLMVEEILDEYRKAGKLKSISFRYFNVGGTDSEGEIGNLYPNPTDVISVLLETAAGKRPQFEIFGTDYETKDGSCVRDLIHVEDLASAHVKGLEKLLAEGVTGVFNLGSESGYTIRELVDMAEKVTGKNFKVVEVGRRPGDIIISIASSEKAKRILGWEPTKTLEDILLKLLKIFY